MSPSHDGLFYGMHAKRWNFQTYERYELLFFIYINDLSSCLKQTKSRLFADDTNITAAGGSISDIHEIAVSTAHQNSAY